MSHLQSLGFTEEFLSEHLISLTCDGAAVMFGSLSGVAKLFKEKFPSIVVWHCASHRLELSVNDAVKEVGEAKEDRTRDKKDCAMYEGLLRKMSSTEFILDLELMCDSLQELSEVSLDLQERNIDLYIAHLKVIDLVEVFEKRKTCPGSEYRKSL
ncbi:hypothetical protein PR048_028961 [Dryococelus australis]|uniref:E3 SUMO-protein ligase KIAA1586-like n=1 Tax=Dryococelus australis TaxID=614101 RepID=A0ABQ9GC11_9NEOP|nr:hypothetical protein PR048_028961 [Dryococelus australis]